MTVSLWQDTASWPSELEHERVVADICIVGGGIVGSLLARQLVEAGKDVVVLEARHVGLGASGRNAGHCIAGLRDNYQQTIQRYGHAAAKTLREYLVESRNWVAEICREFKVPFESNGSRYLAVDEREAKRIRASYEALARDGQKVEWADHDPWERGFPGMLYQAGDLGLQPYLLTTRVMEHSGARLIENSEVRGFEQRGASVTVRSRRATVECAQLILATNGYSRTLHPYFRDLVQPIRAQAYATEPSDERLFEGPTGTNDGFEYFRQLPDGRFLIGGYRDIFPDEEVGLGDETTPHLQAGLEAWVADRFPEVSRLNITHRWSGVMGFTADSLPIIGQLPDMASVYFCIGFNGGGMSYGPAATRLAVEYLLHGTNPGLFSVARN